MFDWLPPPNFPKMLENIHVFSGLTEMYVVQFLFTFCMQPYFFYIFRVHIDTGVLIVENTPPYGPIKWSTKYVYTKICNGIVVDFSNAIVPIYSYSYY